MSTRLNDPTTTDGPMIKVIVIVTAVITIIGVVALIRAAVGDGGVDHVTVRVDNQAGLAVRVDALNTSGDRVGLARPSPGP